MKPSAFDYECPDSVAEALDLLSRNAGRAKIIAGGQSLIPMMNFRVVRPEILIDIGRLIELDYIRSDGNKQLISGSRTRHSSFQTSEAVSKAFPIIPAAMSHVAHLAIRNRGTIGGSLSHADPAAEWPMLALLLDAQIELSSVRGVRLVAAREFLVGSLTTITLEDELLTAVRFPLHDHTCGWAFDEISKRPGDFALAACGVVLRVKDGVIAEARIGLMGVAETAVRATDTEHELLGAVVTDSIASEMAARACAPLSPPRDLHGSPDYRRHLATVLVERCLKTAWRRALGEIA